jgi:hypothetical protein
MDPLQEGTRHGRTSGRPWKMRSRGHCRGDRILQCAAEERGFVYDEVPREDVAIRLRPAAASLPAVPRPNTPWVFSPTGRSPPCSDPEYACHVRDVLIVQRERAVLARVRDRRTFIPMDHDFGADLAVRADELGGRRGRNCRGLLGHLFERLTSDQLERSCT